MSKRLTALILAVMMLVPSLAACGESKINETDDSLEKKLQPRKPTRILRKVRKRKKRFPITIFVR